ncbi:MAG: SGNH/GDSL hydrolase family protein [Verrucomicrobia bacterium]|nr:SGNH/GDSL hydrolase family protein [Verrucomicrobiota bacterium]NDA66391.1 SGNH/GDSL hydrolase family protein [Verrucomicrobiota bacterium]
MLAASSAPTPRRRPAFIAAAVGLALLVAVSLGEIVARVSGFKPFSAEPANLRVEPGGRLFRPLPEGGFGHFPGAFKVTLPDGYEFRVTHGTNGLRVTHPPLAANAKPRPELWVLGCSLTHGWSLNDEDTYPWRVQAALPEFEVVNGGVSGYGTLHQRLLFQELLKQRSKPAVVVVAYGLFHDFRNTYVRIWQKGFAPYNRLPDLVYPFARLNESGQLTYDAAPATYAEWPLQRQSALMHWMEQNANLAEERRVRSHAVSRALLANWAGACLKEGIPFIVAGISSDAAPMLEWCRAAGIKAVDISVPLTEPGNTNAPHDGHPSAKANRVYAEMLVAFLKAEVTAQTRRSSP